MFIAVVAAVKGAGLWSLVIREFLFVVAVVIFKRKWLRQTPISVRMTISDNGPGLIHISADDLFNPLFSTKVGGRGLGLFISHQIVIAHGGILTARDRYPQGAIFEIILPIKPKKYDLI